MSKERLQKNAERWLAQAKDDLAATKAEAHTAYINVQKIVDSASEMVH